MDHLEPDGFLQPKRYRIRYRCNRCGYEYHRVTTKLDRKDPPCPKVQCRVARELEAKQVEQDRLDEILESQRTPAVTGAPQVKMIDDTMRMVANDYKLTNLNDRMREGDIAAPKLDPARQRAADSFFSGAEVARRAGGSRMAARVRQLGAQALAGGLGKSSLNIEAIQKQAAQPGERALRPDHGREGLVRLTPRV